MGAITVSRCLVSVVRRRALRCVACSALILSRDLFSTSTGSLITAGGRFTPKVYSVGFLRSKSGPFLGDLYFGVRD